MERDLQYATLAIVVILTLVLVWVAIQIKPISDLANSNAARLVGSF